MAAPDSLRVLGAFLSQGDVPQTHGRASGGPNNFQLLAVSLDGPNPGGNPAGLDNNGLAAPQHSARECSSDNGPNAPQTESTVDGQPGFADVARSRRLGQDVRERGFEFVQTAAGNSGRGNDRGAGEWRSTKLLADESDGRGFIGLDEVDLVQAGGATAMVETRWAGCCC